jgi:hypothetical protein
MAQQLSGLRQPVLQLVSRHAASMKPKDLAAALGGLAALGWGERRAVRQLLAAAERRMAEDAAAAAAATPAATAAGAGPPDAGRPAGGGPAARAAFGPASLALVARGCALLGVQPSDAFMSGWCRAFTRVLGGAGALDISMAVWALGRLGYRPAARWMRRLAARSTVGSQRGGGSGGGWGWRARGGPWAPAALRSAPQENLLGSWQGCTCPAEWQWFAGAVARSLLKPALAKSRARPRFVITYHAFLQTRTPPLIDASARVPALAAAAATGAARLEHRL